MQLELRIFLRGVSFHWLDPEGHIKGSVSITQVRYRHALFTRFLFIQLIYMKQPSIERIFSLFWLSVRNNRGFSAVPYNQPPVQFYGGHQI